MRKRETSQRRLRMRHRYTFPCRSSSSPCLKVNNPIGNLNCYIFDLIFSRACFKKTMFSKYTSVKTHGIVFSLKSSCLFVCWFWSCFWFIVNQRGMLVSYVPVVLPLTTDALSHLGPLPLESAHPFNDVDTKTPLDQRVARLHICSLLGQIWVDVIVNLVLFWWK